MAGSSGDTDRTSAEEGIPGSIAAAWGVRERPHKGPKPALSLPRIVDAAVRVADAEGLDAVSMGRVAAELGAAPMSLYRHVSAKEELLRLIGRRRLGRLPRPAGARPRMAGRAVPMGLGAAGRRQAPPVGGAHSA